MPSESADLPHESNVLRQELVVLDFLKKYEHSEKARWKVIAEAVQKVCERILEVGKVRARFDNRAKDTESLKDKLENLVKREPRDRLFKEDQDIRDTIHDLAGARISLYVPMEQDVVRDLIKSSFQEVEYIKHDGKEPGNEASSQEGASDESDYRSEKYKRRFPGYIASHYRVQLKPDDAERYIKRYKYNKETIEIQVTSAFQNAWSEAEHDIIYKTLNGTPSWDESSILDAIRGLVLAAELLQNQLHVKFVTRMNETNKRFASDYELGPFLINEQLGDALTPITARLSDGNLDALRQTLELNNMNNVGGLKKILEELKAGDEAYVKAAVNAFEPFDLNVPLCVMYTILHRKVAGNVPDERTSGMTSTVLEPTWEIRCKIMMSAIIWLAELFQPALKWEAEFSKHKLDDAQSDALRFLAEGSQPRLWLIDQETLTDSNIAKLDILWDWFDSHSEEIVKFAFAISKMGVLRRFPQDLWRLDVAWSPVKVMFEPRKLQQRSGGSKLDLSSS